MKFTMPMMQLPFRKLLDGSKKIEVRLYTEKCQKVRPNDIIEFECPELGKSALCLVKGFVVFDSANTMVDLLPPEAFGYDNREEIRIRLNRMFLYEDQAHYGVIGFLIECLDIFDNQLIKEKFENMRKSGEGDVLEKNELTAKHELFDKQELLEKTEPTAEDETLALEQKILEKTGRIL